MDMEWALFEILSAWRNLAIVTLHMATYLPTYLTLPESLSKKTIVSLANVSPNSPPATILHNLHISSHLLLPPSPITQPRPRRLLDIYRRPNLHTMPFHHRRGNGIVCWGRVICFLMMMMMMEKRESKRLDLDGCIDR